MAYHVSSCLYRTCSIPVGLVITWEHLKTVIRPDKSTIIKPEITRPGPAFRSHRYDAGMCHVRPPPPPAQAALLYWRAIIIIFGISFSPRFVFIRIVLSDYSTGCRYRYSVLGNNPHCILERRLRDVVHRLHEQCILIITNSWANPSCDAPLRGRDAPFGISRSLCRSISG